MGFGRNETFMKKRRVIRLLSAIGMAAAPWAVAAEPSVYPTGTTIYDPQKAFNSFVLFAGGDGVTRLIDLNGAVAHEWRNTGQPPFFIDPALAGGARGHIFVTLAAGRVPACATAGRPARLRASRIYYGRESGSCRASSMI